ncbi:hypothetical protein PWP89_13150 [Stenotrophomonas rhizophila]|uniref:hypothetical protein n=1 Tax=Stenotrophomonas rhizophila TaxID=216778 RepID=UPI000B84A3B0|nr:hypothetical protein [Stenotrophomonas rhizophila]
MTQRHICHPEGLPKCAAGHSARHIHDLRGLAAGGGHFIECQCQASRRHPEPDAALAEWRRINRPFRSARRVLPAIAAPAPDTVVQMRLLMPGEGRVDSG